jgi:metal-sulfur cluster biosynthetic enzyme
MSELSQEELREALKDVFDPELGYNIVDLGLIYDIAIAGSEVSVTMTMTAPGCPASDMIQGGVYQRLLAFEGVSDDDINLVWEPPWDTSAMSPVAKEHFGIPA